MELISAQGREELKAIRRRLHDVRLRLPETTNPAGTVRLEGLDERSSLIPIRSFGPLTQFERRKALVVLVIDQVLESELIDQAESGMLDLANI
jgi:hypothetical protein